MENDVRLVSGGTDNHLMLADVYSKGMTGKEAEALLDEAHITVNKNTIPTETLSPFVTSGIRIGTPAITTRGFKEEEAAKVGKWIAQIVTEGESAVEKVKTEVAELCAKFPLYKK